MDFHDLKLFVQDRWLEVLLGALTLTIGLWIAFGPLRHRIPKFFTRLGKYSATFKLISLSGVCWFGLYKAATDSKPSMALNWLLGSLGVVLLAGAIWVVTRKQGGPRHKAPHALPPGRSAVPHRAPGAAPRP